MGAVVLIQAGLSSLYISQLARSPRTLMIWVIVSGLFWIITVKANACWLRLTQAESNYSQVENTFDILTRFFFFHWFFHWMNSVCGLQKNSEFNHLSTTKNIQMSSFCISYFNNICDESASLVSVLIVCCPGLADWISSAAGHPGTYLTHPSASWELTCFSKIICWGNE